MAKELKIAIVGGGVAGLTAAWFLKKAGYKNVTVFEKSERIGGKCKSLTFQGRSFDLGANYITSSYTQIRRLARTFGAEMFTERRGHAYDLENKRLRSLFRATTRQYGIFRIGWAALRYLIIRYKMRRLFTPYAPGFLAASDHPDLCGSLHDWLAEHNLQALEPVFNVPITLMGYDKLRQIPAAYALTYMSPGSFLNLMMFAVNFPFRSWPKRFELGYERLLEKLAAELNVLRGANIHQIDRGDTVRITYDIPATQLTETRPDHHVEEFDALILACPLLVPELKAFLDLTTEERRLFHQVELDPFVVATYPTSCEVDVSAVTFMYPRPKMGEPYVITQQFHDVPLLSIYSRMDRKSEAHRDTKITHQDVLDNNQKLLHDLGAGDPDVSHYTFDEWPYFPHVSSSDMKAGFYKDLEALQGVKNTYYAGGLLAFELAEPITEYSRHLVLSHFGENL